LIRYKELEASHKLIFELLEKFIANGKALEATPKYLTTLPQLDTDSMVIAVTEAWRGELIHIGITDENGKFARYKIVDPSFRNWFGLAYALRNEQISNFPICNKSFNLSYCGTDL
jgi:Ni,Fe-hydrogenase III large subunit